MKTEYGIPVPRGVPKDWEATSMTRDSAGALLCARGVPAGWGNPANCVAWFDRFGRCRLCAAHYGNGRAAEMRIDENGVWRLKLGNVPASVDTHPKDGDALAAPLVSGAVGEAETPND